MPEIRIGEHLVGDGHPVFVVAEIGVNHNGSRELLKQLVEAALETGVNAIKFQVYSTDRLAVAEAPKAKYQEATTSPSETQHQLLHRLELSRDSLSWLMNYCRERNCLAFATPFDEDSADFLHGLGVPVFKIGSGDLTNIPLLRHVAQKGRPMIISTGMSKLGEVEEAIEAIYREGCRDIMVCHCTSNYPARVADANLKVINTLRQAFQVPIGYSDHTMGVMTSAGAVALGAVLIEKHFTLDRSLPGPDQKASLEPHEFRTLVQAVRDMEAALGSPVKRPQEKEWEVRNVAFRSLVAACDVPEGATFNREMLICKRPGTGIEPKFLNVVVGRKARIGLKKDEILTWEKL